jgi:hypothetical protein
MASGHEVHGDRVFVARDGERVRRAISFVPSSPASARVSRTAIALSAAPMRRVEG